MATTVKRPPFRALKGQVLTYERLLRKISRNIGDLTTSMAGRQPEALMDDPAPLVSALQQYSETLRPWATVVAGRMLADVSRTNGEQWRRHAEQMSRSLRDELRNTGTGDAVQKLLAEQVSLITSLPTDAAQRVQRIALESRINGSRAGALKNELLSSGSVSDARATLIARTETSRASAILTQARAEAVGSTGYIWRSHHDARTRPSHRAMNGQFVLWSDPPTIDGYTFHAGCIFNCRCFQIPVFPE